MADVTFIEVPKKSVGQAWAVTDHHLWVTPLPDGRFHIEERDRSSQAMFVVNG